MKTYLYFGYREWAINIFNRIRKTGGNWELCTRPALCNKEFIDEIKPDIIFFYGWSWKVADDIIDAYPCLCLHPSPLPKYRGGSPIQNQIINGETESAVTIFKMGKGIDDGHIIKQHPMSLEGYLCDIFDRMVEIGERLTWQIIESYNWDVVQGKPQDESDASYCYRRNPTQSEIFPESFQMVSAELIYDMVRCLQHPYPEVFIKCKTGKLILERVRYEI